MTLPVLIQQICLLALEVDDFELQELLSRLDLQVYEAIARRLGVNYLDGRLVYEQATAIGLSPLWGLYASLMNEGVV